MSNLPILDDGLAKYTAEVNKMPFLTNEEEFDLAKKWADDQDIEAAHLLVSSHLRLVVKIAYNYKNYGLPMTDIISEGNIGLMQAVKKFEPEKGFRLSTYAMWWIKASIQEHILKSWSLVKIGTTATQKKLFFNLRKVKNKIQDATSNFLSNKETKQIADELGVSEQDVIDMDQRMSGNDKSLNDPIGEEGTEHIDAIESNFNHENDIIRNNELEYQKNKLSIAMESLNDREKSILQARKLQEVPATLEDLSKEYNISRERVRQIESRALEKLQKLVN